MNSCGGWKTVFREIFASCLALRPEGVDGRVEHDPPASRIIYAVALRRANHRSFLRANNLSLSGWREGFVKPLSSFFFFFPSGEISPPLSLGIFPSFQLLESSLSFFLPFRETRIEIRGVKFFFTSNSNLVERVENEIFKTLPFYLFNLYNDIQFYTVLIYVFSKRNREFFYYILASWYNFNLYTIFKTNNKIL